MKSFILVVVSPYQGDGATSGRETHTLPGKDETTDREELLKKLWKTLAREGLAVVEYAIGGPLYGKRTSTSLDISMESISLGRVTYSEKQELGRCQRCGDPLLAEVYEAYEVGILIDKSSDEAVAIFAMQERYEESLDNRCKAPGRVKYIVGLRPMKVELYIMEGFSGWKNKGLLERRGGGWETEVTEPPTPTPKTLTIIREYLQSLITELKKEKKTDEKGQLFRRCNEILHMVEELIAEKITELEKKMNRKIHEAFYPTLWDDETAKLVIEKDVNHIIQILKENCGLEEWLNPPKCENITQINEHTKRETICMGTLLDLHLHLEYEAVKKDEGLTITATIKPIRIPEASKQQ